MKLFMSGILFVAQEIIIDSSIRKQKIIGFGGAFTDAAGINIAQLSVVAQERLMRYNQYNYKYNQPFIVFPFLY